MIRKAVEEDAKIIVEINIKGWQNTYKDIFPRDFLNNLDKLKEENIVRCQKKISEYIVYEENDKILGFVKYGINKKGFTDKYGEIYAIYVDSNYQGRSVGSKLLKETLKRLEKDFDYVLVSTLIQNSANEFYIKEGFTLIGKSKFNIEGESYDENLYCKSLSDLCYQMKLQPEYYNYILNGTKKIELRLNDEKRKNIKIGDKIKFLKEPELQESFMATVINLYKCDSFDELFKHFDISLLADRNMTKEKLICDLEKFYTKEKQRKYGVIGIEISLESKK